MSLNIALLQLAACGNDQQANLEKGERFCREAAKMGADIALFPEMWNIGYQFPDYKQPDALATFAAQAVGRDSAFVQHFKNVAHELQMAIGITYLEQWPERPRNSLSLIDRHGEIVLAHELQMAIGITYLEQWPERPRNSLSLIDRHGEIVLHYAKVHTCEFDSESMLTPGDGFPVADLDTAEGTVKMGAMICFDREFPESARILMLNGAEIILTPNACGLEINRLSQYRARAFENMVGMAMANYAAPDQNGHSVAYDGMPFSNAPEGQDKLPHDMTLVEAGSAEGIYIARFDVEALRRYREYEAMGNAYRRPRLYHALVDERVEPPFVRKDATR